MQIEEGAILEGRVTGIKPFGAFVELEPGVSGMVHISEVSTAYVENIADVLKMGQTVKVKVLSVSPDSGKIALSIKKALPKPESSPAAQNGSRRSTGGRPAHRDGPRVWQPPRSSAETSPHDFDDMLSRFMKQSEERIGDLNRVTENRRGGRKK